ncbi:MAG: 16S rRNA (cytosine(1402)-N(4))-methyltransferase RsmH [Treponema sp.]|jgi:16S rRNA (cytosine1402-N4)-methyltransferase|nr:16S rRNA (cytosine(1402)-N(4))-methyltransferase RsmH [Treponema sp.]
MDFVHTPVMSKEILTFLAPKNKASLFVDANTGEAGHSQAFLAEFEDLKLVCIDVDKDILEIAKKRLAPYSDRIYFYNGWSYDFFTNYPNELKRPDMILFDLGISSYHYKKSAKGFSFDKDENLDMRLCSNDNLTAADIIARFGEKELADLFYNNSGEKHSRRIASFIVSERQKAAITTTSALNEIIYRAVPAGRHGNKKGFNIHPATRVYQSLRIAVNEELSRLTCFLEAALRVLEPGGRFAVLSYHSGEDRIVKRFIQAKNKNCTCPKNAPVCNCKRRSQVNVLTKKGITPTKEEITRNLPSRSARLRVIEKVLDDEEVKND